MLLEGKIALITGGGTGIGFATAERFIKEGATVYITGRRENKLRDACEYLGERAHYIRADVSDKKAMEHVASVIKEEQGTLDIVFANAGYYAEVPFEELSEEAIDNILNTDLKGTIFTAQACIPILKNGGTIIFNTSMTENAGLPRYSIYAAAKAALKSLVLSLTTELKDRKIRVNAVAPGITFVDDNAPPGVVPVCPPGTYPQVEELTPLGRLGTVTDIANVVAFLASEEAAFITGEEITVDGGITRVFAGDLGEP